MISKEDAIKMAKEAIELYIEKCTSVELQHKASEWR